MDDTTAFERLVAGRIQHHAGPMHPVDEAAVFTAITATQSPRWRFQSMFSATKFVVAGAIVALFGGFLLAGVLTQPSDEAVPLVGASPEVEGPDQSVRSDLLPGVDLITKEIEPGVYQILRDGAGHDLVAEPPRELLFAPDGDLVLFFRSDGAEPGVGLNGFYTLGETGGQALEGIGIEDAWFDAAFDQDDNLFLALDDRLESFDGDTWTELTWPNGDAGASAVEVGPDGAMWVTTCSFGPSPRVARIEGDAWTVLPMPDSGTSGRYCNGTPAHLGIATDGDVWFAADPTHDGVPKDMGLLRFDRDAWVVPELPIELSRRGFGPLALGADGTLWVHADNGTRPDEPPVLLRLRDGEWSMFTQDDLPRQAGLPRSLVVSWPAWLEVDGEGTAWISMGDYSDRTEAFSSFALHHDLLSFDGSTWTQHLTGYDVHRFDVAPDGSVWVTTVLRDCADGQSDPCVIEAAGLYVITPEAAKTLE